MCKEELHTCTLHLRSNTYSQSDQINKDNFEEAYGTHGREDKFLQDFGRET